MCLRNAPRMSSDISELVCDMLDGARVITHTFQYGITECWHKIYTGSTNQVVVAVLLFRG